LKDFVERSDQTSDQEGCEINESVFDSEFQGLEQKESQKSVLQKMDGLLGIIPEAQREIDVGSCCGGQNEVIDDRTDFQNENEGIESEHESQACANENRVSEERSIPLFRDEVLNSPCKWDDEENGCRAQDDRDPSKMRFEIFFHFSVIILDSLYIFYYFIREPELFQNEIKFVLAGEESSLAPLPFPNLGASTASAFYFTLHF